MTSLANPPISAPSVSAPPTDRPERLPFFDIMPKIRRDPLKFFTETANRYPRIVELNLGLDKVLMLNEPAYLKHVSQDNWRNYRKSKFYGALKPILGDGIFLAEDDEWVTQRRLSGLKFQGSDLRQMATDMTSISTRLVERWKDLGGNGARIDVTTEMARVTLEIVLKCLFNVDADERQADIYWALTTYLREAEKRVWNPITLPDWAPTKAKRDCRRALQILDEFVYDIISERRASGESRNDLLQLLVDAYGDPAENGVSPNLLRDQVLSFVLAGHETSANALSWAFCLLSQHPDAAQRLTAEVSEALAGRPAEVSDFSNLRYTKMVLDEALRLYPPVWTISRTAVNDDQIGDVEVKRGTNVMLCAYAVHRESRLWTDPERFDPERFDPDQHKAPEPYAYFPFGAGVRSCLGSRFAVMEALIILATISGEFALHLAPGQLVEPEPMITLRPRGQVFMDLERIRPAGD